MRDKFDLISERLVNVQHMKSETNVLITEMVIIGRSPKEKLRPILFLPVRNNLFFVPFSKLL